MSSPFSPFTPVIPPGSGFGSLSEGGGGEAEAEAEGADGDAPGGAAGSETGDAGAAGASDSDSDSAEGAEGAEGTIIPPTETDGVTTESIGAGSGSPGTGVSAGEGYLNPTQYTQTYKLTNNGGAAMTIRSIQFNTPAGIQHAADLTAFSGGTVNYTDSTLVTSQPIPAGSILTFDVGYNYLYGGLGTRTGSIVVKGSAGLELKINITLIVTQSGLTAGGTSILEGVGTGGGGTGGGYLPPAETAAAGSGAAIETSILYYDIGGTFQSVFWDEYLVLVNQI